MARDRKRELLAELVHSGRVRQALVFMRTKHGAGRLAEQLERDGIRATSIHGNKTQGQRVRALDEFKTGRAEILVATEVAARGLDIEQLPHVINFELPLVPEDYIHRIGRTARAGLEGEAISLVTLDEVDLLRDIERLVGPIPTEYVEGYEPERELPVRATASGQVGRMRRGVGRPSPISAQRPQHTGSAPVGRSRSRRGGRSTGVGIPSGSGRPAGFGVPSGGGRPTGATSSATRSNAAAPRGASPTNGGGTRGMPSGPPRGTTSGPARSNPSGPSRHGAGGWTSMPGENFARKGGQPPR